MALLSRMSDVQISSGDANHSPRSGPAEVEEEDIGEAEDVESESREDGEEEGDETRDGLDRGEARVMSAASCLIAGRSQRANRFQMSLGIVFGLQRVPTASMRILNLCGLSVSARTVHRAMEGLSARAVERARTLRKEQPERTVLLFDNVNIFVRHSTPKTTTSNSSVALTTRTLFTIPSDCQPLVHSDLEAILRIDRDRLTTEMMFGDNDFLQRSCEIQMAVVLLPLLNISKLRRKRLQAALMSRKKRHAIHALAPSKTSTIPMKLFHVNEGTVEGTQEVLKRTKTELGIGARDSFVVAGDLLSVMNVHASRHAARWEPDEKERLDGTYPVAGPWHLLLNWLYMMFRQYGNKDRPNSLERLRQALGRGKTQLDMNKPHFEDGWRLLRCIWTGRLLAMLREELKHNGGATEQTWAPTSQQFFRTMSNLYARHMSQDAVSEARAAGDGGRVNAILFLRDCVMGWEYNSAIQEGDIGRMAAGEKFLAQYFYGAGQTKYGALLLDRILEDAIHPKIARSLRAAQLINTNGKANSWQGADHFQELLNGRLQKYDVPHATDQVIVRFEDRISAFVGAGQTISEGVALSLGIGANKRRKREKQEKADIVLVARDAAEYSLSSTRQAKRAESGQANEGEDSQPKKKTSAIEQARQVWDSINPSMHLKTKDVNDLLERGYLKLAGGLLAAYKSKKRDIRSRDKDVFEMAHGTEDSESNNDNDEDESSEHDRHDPDQLEAGPNDDDLRMAELELRSRGGDAYSDSDDSDEEG
ncbi:hypothetical protein CF326_g7527 [Tilletia indica]|nr:hypothetical protein CF326_g7527 [Tilletia indica]